MTLQAGKDPMVTHPLSDVYGMYVIEFDGQAQFCTSDPQVLFENLEGVQFKDCGKVRVILLSSEEWARDDITAFVWGEMLEHYAKDFAHDTLAEWDEHVCIDIPFCRWGYDEFNPLQESLKRKAAFDERKARLAKFREHADAPFLLAAE